jgi:D-glycero-alpha-D-manno-heptose 1-phosphate guanylyltransferase
MEAVILAGGEAVRLRSRLDGIPKPMAPIAGRPFLAWLLDQLDAAGFRRVVLSVGRLGEVIKRAFGRKYAGLDLDYAVEAQPLGTGGAIRLGLEIAGSGDEPIWIMNGDSLLCLTYRAVWDAHRSHAANARGITMAVAAVNDASRYGAVDIQAGRVTRFAATGRPGRGLINSGVYLVHRRLIEEWPLPDAFSFEHDFLAPFADRLEIHAFIVDGWFIDIGIPEDYDRAQAELPAAVSRKL